MIETAKVRSEFETRMLRALRPLRLPFVPNHPVNIDGHRYRIDFAFPEYRVGVECHSVEWHLGHEAFKRDAERHRRLVLAGWTILYFCWDDVVFAPWTVTAQIHQALGAALFSVPIDEMSL